MSDVQGTPEPGGLSRIPFTVAAEDQIKSLSFWLKVVGWLAIAVAVFELVTMVWPRWNLGQLLNFIVHVAIGAWALQAATAFQNVATTDVADQAYLVEGFTKLRSIFLLQGVLILIGLAFVAALLLYFFLAPHAAVAR
jgi:hypothetical protein